jgi:hypothetical protein
VLTALVLCLVCAAILQVYGSAAGLGATARHYTLDAKLTIDAFLEGWRATKTSWKLALQEASAINMFKWLELLWRSEEMQLKVNIALPSV